MWCDYKKGGRQNWEIKNYLNEKLSSQEQSLTCPFNILINYLKAEITK